MFIFYDPETLNVNHIVIYAPDGYAEFLKTQEDLHWIEADTDIPVEQIALTPDKQIVRKQTQPNTGG